MQNILNINENTNTVLLLWGITLGIFFIFTIILVSRISKSMKKAAENNGRINQYLAAVPADRIGTVNAVYQNSRKNLAEAMILSVVGGLFGLQRIYIGKQRSAVFMFLFFWTGIPAIISLFDLANMPDTISTFNLSVAESLYNQIAAPPLE